ncbi:MULTISPECIES: sucrase ferredoxin [Nostoc]|uniref:Sucrase ferredoxin n=1 Tax=Nostoc paludosum FACHB-159 TaxID=2692908 RepID=A0ABR8K5H8_9NOSO|nr:MULTISPECIES: sucrase ferredoxin [Nostoc]MBD2678639.1 sucrase ferredoxin [Nostoc sp. FACHB-857]MBD2734690.1 sucrase ferredoxin [Nostoc paludosum FACHB-159]
MNTFFCSDYSRQAGEDIIGSATNYQTYILVECPPPWTSEAFNSKWVAENLRILIEEVKRAKLPIRFLLIANDLSHKVNQTTLLIYQKKEGLNNGYHKQEFILPNIDQVAPVVQKWLWGIGSNSEVEASATRDILVCTHGSHDKCCARYGNPFYFHATATISNLDLDNVRIWKSSHFGGHRFAPTIIDLPDGRYYGNVDLDSFKSILTRTGDIQCLNKVYRGWGILPPALQSLEKKLILSEGWDWFNYKVAGKILEQSLDNNTILGELSFENTSGSLYVYQAKLIKDTTKTQKLKSSCNAAQESVITKYTVANAWLTSSKVMTYSA